MFEEMKRVEEVEREIQEWAAKLQQIEAELAEVEVRKQQAERERDDLVLAGVGNHDGENQRKLGMARGNLASAMARAEELTVAVSKARDKLVDLERARQAALVEQVRDERAELSREQLVLARQIDALLEQAATKSAKWLELSTRLYNISTRLREGAGRTPRRALADAILTAFSFCKYTLDRPNFPIRLVEASGRYAMGQKEPEAEPEPQPAVNQPVVSTEVQHADAS